MIALAYCRCVGAQNAAPASHISRSVHPQRGGTDCDIRDGIVTHGLRHGHDVALTFDACPTSHRPGFSEAILDFLRTAGVPATFFISGRWAESHRQEFAQLTAVPFFEIGLHGYGHRRLIAAPAAAVFAEIDAGRRALERLGATPAPVFRPPYGDQPPTLAATAQHAGVVPVLWDVAPGDPDPQVTAAMIEKAVLQRARGGSIIVLHVNGRGIGTAAALPAIVSGLRERGFDFVTVSELVRHCD